MIQNIAPKSWIKICHWYLEVGQLLFDFSLTVLSLNLDIINLYELNILFGRKLLRVREIEAFVGF
jgi:hypothetical protein